MAFPISVSDSFRQVINSLERKANCRIDFQRSLSGGLSGAEVALIDCAPLGGRRDRGSPSGQCILKLWTAADIDAQEPERHAAATEYSGAFAKEHIPKLITSVVIERRAGEVTQLGGALYEIAGSRLSNLVTADRLDATTLEKYCSHLAMALFCELNESYSDPDTQSSARKSLRELLNYRLDPAQAPRLHKFARGQTEGKPAFVSDGETLVNPLWFCESELTDGDFAMTRFMGLAHGDLHPGNILLVRSESRRDRRYWLIDWALSRQAPLGYDQAYLELSLLIRNIENGGPARLFKILADLDPEDTAESKASLPRPSLQDAGLVACLRAIRSSVMRWQREREPGRGDPFLAQQFLNRVAVGLNWANKPLGDFRCQLAFVYAAWSARCYLERFHEGEWLQVRSRADTAKASDGSNMTLELKPVPKDEPNTTTSSSVGDQPAPRTELLANRGALTVVRGNISALSIGELVKADDWIVGAVNFDEDLHFSSFYTRQSCIPYLPPEYSDLGYSRLVGIYENFSETYYIPTRECSRVAEAILERILDNPLWMQGVLDLIHARAEALGKVFSDTSTAFPDLSDAALLDAYRAHNRVHRELYVVARIPEAMDRGVPTFTNYLKAYLRKRGAVLAGSLKELNHIFEVLTFPEELGSVRQELAEFHSLLHAIKKSTEGTSILTSGARRAWLKMTPAIRSQIEGHRKKWGYWGYHGYGTRTLPDVDYYLHRLASALGKQPGSTPTAEDYRRSLTQGEEKRNAEFRRLGVDELHQMLFRIYSRVGTAKLHRRHIQLRNFWFLDQLLSEISQRMDTAEEVVRCMLPEEIVGALEAGGQVPNWLQRRVQLAVHVISTEGEAVLAGDGFNFVRDAIHQRTQSRKAGTTRLEGTPVCTGIARGPCKIIIRQQDAEAAQFQPGDILVSESTDPDLRDLMEESAAVVTEAGGVTSHAAILCREMSKPAIVGVEGLLSVVKNGDFAVVNADEGYISIVRWEGRKWTIDGSDIKTTDAHRVGAKAVNLSRMLQAGLRVPRFLAIPFDRIEKEISSAVKDASGPQWDSLRAELCSALEYLTGDLFILRSSVVGEDDADQSHAGEYASLAHVERQDVVTRVLQQIVANLSPPQITRGATIVQEMVLGDFSGVCMTRHPLSERAEMLAEVVPGGNDTLTSGKVVPIRYAVDRDTRQVSHDQRDSTWSSVVAPQMWEQLIQAWLDVERLFGTPQDIEWTAKGRDIWLLQSRPITTASESAYRHRAQSTAEASLDMSAVYSAYRVSPNLRMHLLRVAGVAALICDKWGGPPIRPNEIILTSLIHDIGNIVKANYDRFPALYPEQWADLQYWKAVQEVTAKRYGETDQEATLNIARELGVSDRILHLLERKTFLRNEETLSSTDWDLKICAYADQRVGPRAVMALNERLAEAKERYRGVVNASVNNPRFLILAECAETIENQIARHLQIRPEEITEAAIAPYIEGLRNFRMPPHGSVMSHRE